MSHQLQPLRTEAEAMDWLHSLSQYGIRLGLHRMERLLARLGHPEDHPGIIHVAGTNGKGSVSASLAAMLQAAGLRTGLFTSPHLERFGERIRVDGQELQPWAIVPLVNHVRQAVAALVAEGMEHPTEFEAITAMAWLWFQSQRVDAIVLEVGLGGRYDSTNVLAPPLLTVVTNVALDHTDRLGDTIERVAREKAGIFKPGVTAVTAATGPALDVLIEEAAAVGCPLWHVAEGPVPQPAETPCPAEGAVAGPQYATAGPQHATAGPQHATAGPQHATAGPQYATAGPQYATAGPQHATVDPQPAADDPAPHPPGPAGQAHWQRTSLGLDGGRFTLHMPGRAPQPLKTPLLGAHQLANAALAAAAAQLLPAPWRPSAEAVRRGLAATAWPGRLEKISSSPLLLLDGAHNPAGAAALARAVQELLPGRRIDIVFTCMRDKDAVGMLEALRPVARSLTLTTVPGARAPDLIELQAQAIAVGMPAPVDVEPNAARAVERARERAGADGVVIACGSLYLVGLVRHIAQALLLT